jgi:hypothetical protein
MVPSASVLRTITVGFGLVSATLVGAPAAHANPAGVVPTAGAPDAGAAVHVVVDYAYELDDAQINREQVGAGADPLGPQQLRADLAFRQVRQLVTPRAELAIYRNVWVSFAAPIVLAQSSELRLAAGVDRLTSSTFADGLLPAGGFDAQAPGTPLTGDLAFRSIQRRGVPELRGGLGWAPMNQALDDTKPTWKLGVEGRFAIGPVMQLDAADPASDAGVSTGVHELRVWTSIDRRFRYFEGWFEVSFRQPIATSGDSLFQDPGFGARSVRPGPTGSAAFGLETYVVDHPTSGRRYSIDVGGRLTTHFEGRGYSEMWEVFAFAGGSGGPLQLDADPLTSGVQALANPGVSNIEGYLEASGRVALRARLGRHVSLAALGEVVWKSNHVISFADAGVDLPTCPLGGSRCENDNNDLVNPGTQEVNPLQTPLVDLVGHRYQAVDNRGIVLGAEVQILF